MDLDVYSSMPVPVAKRPDMPSLPADLWSPGSRLAFRGESPALRAFAHAGYATMAIWALTQALSGPSPGFDARAAAAGFGAISAMHLWGGAGAWRDLRETRVGDVRTGPPR
ncbi:MAG: hypothetical protein HY549_01080 [Elusimicrobia bacterium]|nr:hypothetical protein [Elusimicrobiota bacterium]